MQDCLHELNAQVDKVRTAGEKVREHENKCKRPENKYYYWTRAKKGEEAFDNVLWSCQQMC